MNLPFFKNLGDWGDTFSVAFCLYVLILGSGCTNLFLQPTRTRYPALEYYGLKVREFKLPTVGPPSILVWDFPVPENQKAAPAFVTAAADHARGIVLQVHGNGENMSSHFQSLAWLPFAGFELVTFDYRGYGASEGAPDVEGALEDTKAAIRYVDQECLRRGLKWSIVGQSLGGTLALKALEEQPTRNLKLILIESAFHSYREIAQEKLADFWLTWPFQWLAKIFISDQMSPAGSPLATFEPRVPVVLLYSKNDEVVPFDQGQKIFSELRSPKELWTVDEPGHINGFDTADRRYRKKYIDELNQL